MITITRQNNTAQPSEGNEMSPKAEQELQEEKTKTKPKNERLCIRAITLKGSP